MTEKEQAQKIVDNLLCSNRKKSVMMRVDPEFRDWLQNKVKELEKAKNNDMSISQATQILVNELKKLEEKKEKKNFDFRLF